MIVVRVELWSAVTGEKTELARMHVNNTGERLPGGKCNYEGKTFIGRDSAALDRQTVSKRAMVQNWPRDRFHVWNLVRRMLDHMGYDA